MSLTRHSIWLVLVAIVGACFVFAPGPAWGQFQYGVNYFSNNTNGGADETVRIINPGAYAPTYPPASLCAMIYVFDNMQEMKDCCACQISTDGIAQLSVQNDLTWNPFNGKIPDDGNIKVIAAKPNGFLTLQPTHGQSITSLAPCDPTGGGIDSGGNYVLDIVPLTGLVGWSTHAAGYLTPDNRLTEERFISADLSPDELVSLQEQCTGLVNTGSGLGICTGQSPNSGTICDFPTPKSKSELKAMAAQGGAKALFTPIAH